MRGKIVRALVLGLLSLWVAAAASAHGRLPKGTAYAAEIRVTVTYDGIFAKTANFHTDCTDADGNDVQQGITETQREHIDRTVRFRHITVPVVPAFRLGKAARRLALKPAITDPGHVSADFSSYRITGTQADDSTCPQTLTNYICDGNIENPGPILGTMASGEDGFAPEIFDIPVFSNEVGAPAGCAATGESDVATDLGTTAAQAYPAWQEVRLQGLLSSRFYALRTRHEVDFTVPVGPAAPCSDSSADSCTQSATGSAHVKLQRLFLYRTKRSYAK